MSAPQTFGDLLRTIRAQRFVGRSTELTVFRHWLDSPTGPPVLAVYAPGGMGKSWLLDACGTQAEQMGRIVYRVDGVAFDPGFEALAEPTASDDALLVVDAVDAMGPAVAWLQQTLTRLRVGTKVVLSSRPPLREGIWRRWQPLMRHLALGPLALDEQLRYLDIRGLDDPRVRTWVLDRSGGHPLILSLAVDLLLNSSQQQLERSRLWRSTVRMTVDELVGEVGPGFREAIAAAAVLQRFDRAALAGVLGPDGADAAFVRLGGLSATAVAGDELTLHEDVRAAVIEDLRLHDPERLKLLRHRAQRHYRRAAAICEGDEARALSMKRLQVIGRDVFGLNLIYEGQAEVTVRSGTPDDLVEILGLLERFTPFPGMPRVERDPVLLRALLSDDDTHVQVAHDAQGTMVAYGFYVRVSERNRSLLAPTPAMEHVLSEATRQMGLLGGDLPSESNLYYLSTVVSGSVDWAVTAAMARLITHLFLEEGAFLFVTSSAEYQAVAEGLGAVPIAPGTTEDGMEFRCRFLDLSLFGFEGLLRALDSGTARRPPLPLGDEMVQLVRSVVAAHEDDAVLAASPLAEVAESDDAPVAERAQAVRELLGRAAVAAGPWPTPEHRVRDALVAAGLQADVLELRRRYLAVAPPAGVGPAAPAPRAGSGPAIRLLGAFEVWREGRPVPVPQGAVATLVKLVAMRRAVPVDELVEALWPDVDPVVGRDRLKTVVARTRRATGPDVLARRGDELILGPAVDVDAHHFEQEASAALSMPQGAERRRALQEATTAYGGELLPGDRYEDWAAATRERLARRFLDLLDARIAEARAGDAVDEVLGLLQQAIDVDPYEEGRYLEAATLLLEAGRRGRALAVVQQAEAAAASLGVAPSGQLVALKHRLRTSA